MKESTISTDTTSPAAAVEGEDALDDEAIHGYFGLTYSNYLVLHRTLMQSMPAGWQHRAVAVFRELEQAFEHIERPDVFIVTAATECEYSDLNDADMKELGVTQSEDGDVYFKDGEEHQPWDRMLVPAAGGDPVPHYRRGRTHIEPRFPDKT